MPEGAAPTKKGRLRLLQYFTTLTGRFENPFYTFYILTYFYFYLCLGTTVVSELNSRAITRAHFDIITETGQVI